MSLWNAAADDSRYLFAQEVLTRLGDKWSVRIIAAIAGPPIRFTDLKRKIGLTLPISARMLTRILKQLEHDGFIQRKVFPVIPPRVEYRLTGLGQRFFELTG